MYNLDPRELPLPPFRLSKRVMVGILIVVSASIVFCVLFTPAVFEPIFLTPTQRQNMANFESIDPDSCYAPPCPPYGWGPPVFSPNGEYFYKTHHRHYGWYAVAVLTSDYSRVIYYNSDNDMSGMQAGGCIGDGWLADGTLKIACYRNGEFSVIGRLDPETGDLLEYSGAEPIE